MCPECGLDYEHEDREGRFGDSYDAIAPHRWPSVYLFDAVRAASPSDGLREAIDKAERSVLALVHPYDHPLIHRQFQDVRAALEATGEGKPDGKAGAALTVASPRALTEKLSATGEGSDR